jgi:hypothetical protein
MILIESSWNDSEAKKLVFGSSTDDQSVADVLQQKLERQQQANRTSDDWRDIYDNAEYKLFVLHVTSS